MKNCNQHNNSSAHYHPTYINGQIIHTEIIEALSDILDQMS